MKENKIILSAIITLIMVLMGVTNAYATTPHDFHNFTGLYLETTNVKMGEKVYVNFYGDTKEIEFVNLQFSNTVENMGIVVGIEDLDTKNPYFVLPEETLTGRTYEMISVIIKCKHGYSTYSTIKGQDNFINCFDQKYLTVEKEVDVDLTHLSLASHFTTLEKGQKLWLDVEFRGTVTAKFVTMAVRNKENPEICALVSLKQDDFLQYIDVFDIGTQTELINGTYYISDVFINPDDKENYVRYTLDESATDARKLEYNVEFKIRNNPLKLSNLSLASHYTVMKPDYKLWLDVEIKGEGEVGLITMVVRNKENPEMCALVSLKQDNLLQYIDVFDIGTQEKLVDGTYYISDLYINPNREDYIRYTLDKSADDARTLEFYVEFEIDAEDDKLEDTIVNNPEEKPVDNEEVNKNHEKEENNDVDNEIPEKEENQDEVIKDNENENQNDANNESETEDDGIITDKIESKDDNIIEDTTEKEENIIQEDSENKHNDENSLQEKIYELLLKIVELLTIMEHK